MSDQTGRIEVRRGSLSRDWYWRHRGCQPWRAYHPTHAEALAAANAHARTHEKGTRDERR